MLLPLEWIVIIGLLVVIAVLAGITVKSKIAERFFYAIGVIAALVTLISIFIPPPILLPSTNVVIHVFDKDSQQSISQAGVLLFFEGGRLSGNTDRTGTVQFQVALSNGELVDLVVEADGYQVERINGHSVQDGKIDIPLSKAQGQEANVVISVTNENGEPVPSAAVLLIVEGSSNLLQTDANGIDIFKTTFQEKTLDAQVQVSAEGYEYSTQNVTISPNNILGIRLDRTSRQLQAIDPISGVTSTPSIADLAAKEILTSSITPMIKPTDTPAPTTTPTSLPTETPTPLPPAPTLTSTPMPPSSTNTPTPTDTPTPTNTSVVPIIEFKADRNLINAGECTDLRWVVENVREVYLNENGVAGQGSEQVCPQSNATYTLRVVHIIDSRQESREVAIQVVATPTATHTPVPIWTCLPFDETNPVLPAAIDTQLPNPKPDNYLVYVSNFENVDQTGTALREDLQWKVRSLGWIAGVYWGSTTFFSQAVDNTNHNKLEFIGPDPRSPKEGKYSVCLKAPPIDISSPLGFAFITQAFPSDETLRLTFSYRTRGKPNVRVFLTHSGNTNIPLRTGDPPTSVQPQPLELSEDWSEKQIDFVVDRQDDPCTSIDEEVKWKPNFGCANLMFLVQKGEGGEEGAIWLDNIWIGKAP